MDNQRITRIRTMPYEQYLQTPEWQEKRALVLERDAQRCRACNSDEKLEVHHRTYVRRGYEDLNDLTTLCEGCYEHFHKKIRQDDIMARTYSTPRPVYVHNEYAWEEYLIGMLLCNTRIVSHIRVIVTDSDFAGEATRALYHAIDEVSRKVDTVSDETFLPELMPTVTKCREAVGDEDTRSEEMKIQDAIKSAMRIKRDGALRKNQKVKHLLDEAYKSNNTEEMRRLMIEKSEVDNELRRINIVM